MPYMYKHKPPPRNDSPFFLGFSLEAGSAPPTRATLAGVLASCRTPADVAERLLRVEAINELRHSLGAEF